MVQGTINARKTTEYFCTVISEFSEINSVLPESIPENFSFLLEIEDQKVNSSQTYFEVFLPERDQFFSPVQIYSDNLKYINVQTVGSSLYFIFIKLIFAQGGITVFSSKCSKKEKKMYYSLKLTRINCYMNIVCLHSSLNHYDIPGTFLIKIL